ncbi:MAG: riboflavin biosynthesis protein RibF [Anaerolineales bacterium]
MLHYHSLDNLNLQNTWLTIGIFDGVHRGHQEILHQLVSGAHSAGAPAVVLTFSPHPAVVLGGKTDFKYLTTPEERRELLGSLGVDVVINQIFDRLLADQTAAAFMLRLSQTLDLRHLVIGYDTALGRGREAHAARLKEIGTDLGYSVMVVPALMDTAGVISSTRIRQAVLAGNVSAAGSDLGRPFSITGPVIHGDGRGHTINIPTANIQIQEQKILPAFGIYACRAWVNGQPHLAATSLGVRPTFYGDPPAPTIEAHLLDFHQNLYGQIVKLEFMEYLRSEEKFNSVDALVKQIQEDISQTRNILGKKEV